MKEYELSLLHMQQIVQDLEEELETLRQNSSESCLEKEKELWKMSIVEIMNQIIGKGISDLDSKTLSALNLPNDRVKLHGLVDNLYKNHDYN